VTRGCSRAMLIAASWLAPSRPLTGYRAVRMSDPRPADQETFPKFPDLARQAGGNLSKSILKYILAVLGCTDPEIVAGSASATSPATRRLLDRLTAHHPAGMPRPKPTEWFAYAEYRLSSAPRGAVKAVKAWGEAELLGLLEKSTQRAEGGNRLDDLEAILRAVNESALDASARRTLERIWKSVAEDWVNHHAAWEGFEQLIVPLPPLDEVFDAHRSYTIEQAAKRCGISAGTIRNRIKAGRLQSMMTNGGTRISGAELNRAIAARELDADPRGNTAQGR
jgi:excisionase family DNA binding protein